MPVHSRSGPPTELRRAHTIFPGIVRTKLHSKLLKRGNTLYSVRRSKIRVHFCFARSRALDRVVYCIIRTLGMTGSSSVVRCTASGMGKGLSRR